MYTQAKRDGTICAQLYSSAIRPPCLTAYVCALPFMFSIFVSPCLAPTAYTIASTTESVFVHERGVGHESSEGVGSGNNDVETEEEQEGDTSDGYLPTLDLSLSCYLFREDAKERRRGKREEKKSFQKKGVASCPIVTVVLLFFSFPVLLLSSRRSRSSNGSSSTQ